MIGPEDRKDSFRYIGRGRLKLSRFIHSTGKDEDDLVSNHLNYVGET